MRVLAGPLLIAVAAGCAPLPPVAPPDTSRSGPFVYLVNHGWHVGIAVARQEVSPAIWPESAEFSGFPYLEVEDLARFIHATYVLDASDRPVVVAPGLYGHSAFYRATGQYRLQDNSNNWTARALAVAGCPIDAAGAITAGGVMYEARRFGHVIRGGALWRNVTAGGPERLACR